MRSRLFDCFIFFDELEVLELRLAELSNVVDHFVLVGSTLTFSGRQQPHCPVRYCERLLT